MNNFDKEIVKMDKSNAVVVGLKIDMRKIFTENFKELVEEMCYHGLARDFVSGNATPDPAATFAFIKEHLTEVLSEAADRMAHRTMLEIITKDPQEIKREIFKRCLGEDAPVDDEAETVNEESVEENEQ